MVSSESFSSSAMASAVGKDTSSTPRLSASRLSSGDKREGALCSGPDHETTAVPRDLLRERQRRVTIRGAQLSGRLLVALSDNASVEHHVVVVGLAVDLDRAERETLEAHRL